MNDTLKAKGNYQTSKFLEPFLRCDWRGWVCAGSADRKCGYARFQVGRSTGGRLGGDMLGTSRLPVIYERERRLSVYANRLGG